MVARIRCFLVRSSSFLRKEVVDIVRQPRLLFTLVLGPFLILLLFGIGYRAVARPVRTLFVIPPDSDLKPYMEQYADSLVKQLVPEGIVSSEPWARVKLLDGEVDAVIVVPSAVYERFLNSEQATFRIYHDEIDPLRLRYVEAFANVFVTEVNRNALEIFAEEAQRQSGTLGRYADSMLNSASTMRGALESDDLGEARRHLQELERELEVLESTLGTGGMIVAAFQELFHQSMPAGAPDLASALANIEADVNALWETRDELVYNDAAVERLDLLQADLTRLRAVLDKLQQIDPRVIATPFRTEVASVQGVDLDIVDFYVPSVIALLLQHLCVTFGALTIVMEREAGTFELFQASPLSAIEVLLGKYLSYLLFSAVLAATLTGLLAIGLTVPMRGSWFDYAVVIGALLFASLSIGFVLSLVARTTTQAVQYSMIALLSSVFFTGFFLNLQLLRPEVRILSRAIPATYGIELLQGVMLRGRNLDQQQLLILLALGCGFFLVAWLLLRRAMARI